MYHLVCLTDKNYKLQIEALYFLNFEKCHINSVFNQYVANIEWSITEQIDLRSRQKFLQKTEEVRG